MAIIKCPECQKEISDQSLVCIGCGCPIKKEFNNTKCNINGVEYDLSFITNTEHISQSEKLNYIDIIIKNTNCEFSDACNLINEIIQSRKIPNNYIFGAHKSKYDNTPKCPTCNSTNVKRISGTAKIAGAVAFGLFSKTARSQFKCGNCGYKW